MKEMLYSLFVQNSDTYYVFCGLTNTSKFMPYIE